MRIARGAGRVGERGAGWRPHGVWSAWLCAAALGATAATPASAEQPLVVPMATLAPSGSSWHRILKQGAREWEQLSAGRLKVRLFPSGVAGDDPEMVEKLRSGRLAIAVLGSVGLGRIDPSVYALGVPMMYASPEEARYVLEGMRPGLEDRFAHRGFVVLGWFESGWVRFFSDEPVATPDQLRARPLLVQAGDQARSIWGSAGFATVALPASEVAEAIDSGRVGAIGMPPQLAVLSQTYLRVPHMTALPWQLVVGALVMRRAAWEELPAELRPSLLEAARGVGQQLDAELRGSAQRDVAVMSERGLDVVAVDAAGRDAWRKAAEAMYPRIRGEVVPEEAFDEALRLRTEFRRRDGGQP